MAQQERQTAKLATAEEMHSGKYFQKEGFTPNYLLTPEGRRFSRIRIVGTVVDTFTNEDETYGSITLDDGSDSFQVKFFNDLEQIDEFEEGDIIEVAGKVREYQGEIYMNAEILVDRTIKHELLHKLRHKKEKEEWTQIRKTVKQLKDSDKSQEDIEKEMAGKLSEDEVDSLLQSFGEKFDKVNDKERENLEKEVIDAVEKLSEGDGADYGDIVDEVGESEEDLENTINSLLSEGTFYEPKPGKIKKL